MIQSDAIVIQSDTIVIQSDTMHTTTTKHRYECNEMRNKEPVYLSLGGGGNVVLMLVFICLAGDL